MNHGLFSFNDTIDRQKWIRNYEKESDPLKRNKLITDEQRRMMEHRRKLESIRESAELSAQTKEVWDD